MMHTGYTMRDPVMLAMVTREVPPVVVRLEALGVWSKEAEASWSVTTVTKSSTLLGTVGTPL